MTTNPFPLPAGYTARNGHIDDYQVTFDLLNLYSLHINGSVDLDDPEVLRLDWLNAGFNPATDLRMVFAPDGTLVAFEECWLNQEPPVHPWMFGCVHPDHWNKGIGAHLLTWAEARAQAALALCRQELRVAPRTGSEAHNTNALTLFEQFGYSHIRSYYRMRIDFDSAPEVVPAPAGIIIRPFDPETELEAVYRTIIDSFRDHFGFIEQPFEKGFAEFKHNFIGDPGYSPSYWFVAMDDAEMVGACIGRLSASEDNTLSWISELGVRRAWRKRGVGYALLKHAFTIAHATGKKGAALGVDATSLTGATRLYERAGMHVQRRFDQYEKELRPGKELSTQTVE